TALRLEIRSLRDILLTPMGCHRPYADACRCTAQWWSVDRPAFRSRAERNCLVRTCGLRNVADGPVHGPSTIPDIRHRFSAQMAAGFLFRNPPSGRHAGNCDCGMLCLRLRKHALDRQAGVTWYFARDVQLAIGGGSE